MNNADRFADLLRLLASTIEGLTPAEIDLLVTRRARLGLLPMPIVRAAAQEAVFDLEGVRGRLNGVKDRDAARSILQELPNRETVARLARSMKVHVIKHDRREDIESKIIEFLIGGTLRTEAIQSLSLRGGGGSSGEDES